MRITAKDVIVEARVERNGRHGIVVSGVRNDLTRSYSGYNKGFGILLGGTRNLTEGIGVEGNTAGGIGSRGGEIRP
jgi:hypothetical protein